MRRKIEKHIAQMVAIAIYFKNVYDSIKEKQW